MLHDSGRAQGRAVRMRRRFPEAELVVFGHSHIPVNGADPADEVGRAGEVPLLFNPGSPTDRRRQPHGTIGLLRVEDGRLVDARIVDVT
jgi:uncharacterized protein